MSRAIPLDRYRTIGIIAPIDSGKTTTTERILSEAGQVSDTGISISSAATVCNWRDHHVTLIDTPLHLDASVEMARVLRVVDGVLFVFEPNASIEAGFKTVWTKAEGISRLCFVNKMDRPAADFFGCVAALEAELGATPLVLQLPIRSDDRFTGIVDLIAMRASFWNADTRGSAIYDGEIPQGMVAEAKAYRAKLLALVGVDAAAGFDAVKAAIRAGTLDGRFAPVLCGSAFGNRGVHPLLDGIVDYLAAPEAADDAAPFSGLAFKNMSDPELGGLTFLRVYSGTVAAGSEVQNSVQQQAEQIGRIVLTRADRHEEAKAARTGDVVAFTGLKNTVAGDTLCASAQNIVLDAFRENFQSVAGQPRAKTA
jgi:elongation factor G